MRYPPLRYYLERVLRDMGGVSRIGPLSIYVYIYIYVCVCVFVRLFVLFSCLDLFVCLCSSGVCRVVIMDAPWLVKEPVKTFLELTRVLSFDFNIFKVQEQLDPRLRRTDQRLPGL